MNRGKGFHSRRLLLLAMAGTWVVTAAGCQGCRKSKKTLPTDETPGEATDEVEHKKFVVGVVYAGSKQDGGFNQAHARAAAVVAKLAGVKVVEEENVPEDSSSMAYLEKPMVFNKASLVIATSPSHFDPPVLNLAPKYPAVTFRHFGGYYREGLHPKNAGSFHGLLDEAFYVSGVVAGLTTKSKKLGFVASMPVAHVIRCLNAFTLGALSVNPKITTTVVFTGAWSDKVAEEKAGMRLADEKVDVLAMYVNMPQTLLQTADRRGIYSIGVHTNGLEHAPKGYLTGAEWNLTPVYTDMVKAAQDGRPVPRVLRGGLADGMVNISPFGPAVPDKVRKQALDVRERLIKGTISILKGPLKDNLGRVVIPAGTTMMPKDQRLETSTYLVSGVVRSSIK